MCGQAIYLTWLLGHVCADPQNLKFFLPRQDAAYLGADLLDGRHDQPDKAMLRLIWMQVARIEKLFQQGSRLLDFLETDGRRTLTTLLSISWHQLMKIKREPSAILGESIGLTSKEKFQFRMKHVLGLEGGSSAISANSAGDGH